MQMEHQTSNSKKPQSVHGKNEQGNSKKNHEDKSSKENVTKAPLQPSHLASDLKGQLENQKMAIEDQMQVVILNSPFFISTTNKNP